LPRYLPRQRGVFAAFGPEVPNECFDWLSIEGPALYLLNDFPGDFFAVRVCTGASVPVTLEEYDFHRPSPFQVMWLILCSSLVANRL